LFHIGVQLRADDPLQKLTGYHATMMQWLRGRTVFQRVALVLMVLALGAFIVSYFSGGTSASELVMVAAIVCYIAFRKELLWRVRNRLLVTYFLFGVVPIFLIGFLLMLTAELLLGQFATLLVRQDLEARIESVRSTAQNLLLAASHGAKADLLDGIRQRVPKLEAVVRASGDALRLPPDGQFQAAPAWIAPGFADLFESGGRYYIGANVRDGNTEAFAWFPFDKQTLAALMPGVVYVAGVIREQDRTDVRFGPSGSRIAVGQDGVRKDIVPSGLGLPRGWWDVPIAGMLAWKMQAPSGKTDVLLPLVTRPSLLVAGVMTGRMASIVLSVLLITTGFFLILEVISLFSSLRLTRAITRSVDDLYRGTLQVADGDFSHQIPVRGQHQLSDLAASFNSMTAKIRQLIGEVKKKEKLDAELEIARQVQLRLFPKSVPKLKTLEMAGVCIPGRVVSGDYYDYVRLDDRWTAVALGDVSGKGVSAALLMASIQSALHAQLSFSGASSYPVLSTAALMELISQQLYENSPPEKYATFFCSVYDDETGRLTYTNAGHLKPILVRDGQAITLEGDGMVVGLLPNVKYEQQDVLLRTGDLLAIYSDGVAEAEDEAEQQFGETRLAELLVARIDKPLENIITVVTGAVEKWIHDPEGRDDLTLLLLRKL
jgi:sigma-B regulation protein RsbU (phosphoserine phosphatase)